eukprot:g563.t1
MESFDLKQHALFGLSSKTSVLANCLEQTGCTAAPIVTDSVRTKEDLLASICFFWLDSSKCRALFPWKLHAESSRIHGPRVLVNYLAGQYNTLINKRDLAMLVKEVSSNTSTALRHPATVVITLPKGMRRWSSVAPSHFRKALSSVGIPGGESLVIVKPICWSRSDGITVCQAKDIPNILSNSVCFRWKKPKKSGGGQGVTVENSVLVQHYLHRPLLWSGHKFDLRVYVLLLNCTEGCADKAGEQAVAKKKLRFRSWFHHGYARCCASLYDASTANAENQGSHVTNWCRQKTHECYDPETDAVYLQDGENTKEGFRVRRSWEELESFLDEDTPFSAREMMDKTQEMVRALMEAAAPKLAMDSHRSRPKFPGSGQFTLLGLDIMLTVEAGILTPYLIECNGTPQLEMHPKFLKELHSDVLEGLCRELITTREAVLKKESLPCLDKSESQWKELEVREV